MIELVDMHMHLGFSPEASGLGHDLDAAQVAVFANTVTPDEFALLEPLEADAHALHVGLGLHPWWLDQMSAKQANAMVDSFLALLPETRFVGEIGLDFSAKHVESMDQQLECFERIVGACAQRSDLLISLHSVKAEERLLDVLETHGIFDSSTIVLHSYSGSSDQLKRALELGAHFSVGARMLKTKRGREYARILPEERILLESDLPAHEGEKLSARELEDDLRATARELARLRSVDEHELVESTTERGLRLLGYRD